MRGRSAHCMAAAAALFEQRSALISIGVARSQGRLRLLSAPGFECLRWVCDDEETHMCMLRAAIFPALSAVTPDGIGLDPHRIGLSRDDVGLAGERRHPETVDHIFRTK